ncbi:YcaO-like family protein [Streptomyces xanthochromogenes]|uniref:YcaO-like family protein n=1 Tax=Streptomyces xanthochromogenes TaxID=67384 RepID=UPI003432C52C
MSVSLSADHIADPGFLDGVITRTRTFSGLGGTPAGLHLAVADLVDLGADRPWQADRQTFGTSWDGPAAAVPSAHGEAVERYCGEAPPAAGRIRYGSHRELTRGGLRALDPRELVLYSERQYAEPGFPFRPFLADSPTHWIPALSVSRGEPVYVPAFVAYTSWQRMPRPHPEPLYAFPAIGGIAAGPSFDYALVSGLEEVVERDAAAVWWADAQPRGALALTPRLRALTADAGRDYDVRLLHIDNEFGVPVLAAGVLDRAEGWLTYGFAVRADPEEAAAKALAEAYTLQLTSQALDDPDVVPPDVEGRVSPLKPWRRDRRYLDDCAADSRDMVEQLCQQQLYLDRRAWLRAAPWAWDLPAGDWADVPVLADRSADTLRARVEAAGREVIAVDLTTPRARAAGLHVLRVVVPGTVGAAPAAYPARGGRRLTDTPVRLGWRARPQAEDRLNSFPIPHS